ncbi:hypothetical protein DSO57_1036908 [Entomophthora muscae]|uniref:Uncharacterized protein n=1 Tax=Entomophthora muscae TaxID=34485 RepID=A0ACC2SZ61_9FUNG|nr:hypothetical protein DSO57_1036908 [Entomophthora muscae]
MEPPVTPKPMSASSSNLPNDHTGVRNAPSEIPGNISLEKSITEVEIDYAVNPGTGIKHETSLDLIG